MPVLQVNDRSFPIKLGQTKLGVGEGIDLEVGGSGELPAGVHAIIELSSGSQAVVRRGPSGVPVKVNGIALGMEPTPLIHGDKLEIGTRELLYSDDTKAGATQFVSTADLLRPAQKRSGPARATRASGGRLVSLVDGKEYVIPEAGIVIGREASSDVVVAQNEVSRRHAEIVPEEQGYFVRDLSTNGVYVNGERVQQTLLLSRADVVRIGTEEFRFYADIAPAAAKPLVPDTAIAAAVSALGASAVGEALQRGASAPSSSTAGASAPPATAQSAPPAPSAAARPSAPASAGASTGTVEPPTGPKGKGEPHAPQKAAAEPTTAPTRKSEPSTGPKRASEPPTAPVAGRAAMPRPVLASLEVMNEGIDKGRRYEIQVPLAHVGRGAHNDVVIDNDSVSDSHAKLTLRDGVWYVSDLGSTNGTYVAGVRITGEQRLEGTPDVRFGGVKVVFRSASPRGEQAKGTRAIASVSVDRAQRPRAGAPEGASAPPAAQRATSPWVWILIVAAAIAAAFLLLKR